METIKIIITFIMIAAISFGFWLIIFGFIHTNFNPFNWSMGARIVFLLLGAFSTSGVVEEYFKNNF